MSTYDEILGTKPQSSNTWTNDITQYGPMLQETDQDADYPWDGLTQHKPNVAEDPTTNTQPTANTSTHQNAAVQPPKMDDVSKANATLGTPKFDKSISDVLAKKEPTKFETPKESGTPQKQNTTSVTQEQDGPSAAQIARAYALTPTSDNVALTPSSDTQAAQKVRDKSYADMIASLEESMQKNKPLTKEQEEAKKKRDKRNAIISSIGDGLTALANLVATTKGSTNMYDPDNGLAKRYNDYYEKMKAEREAKREAYLKYQNLLYSLGDNRYKELAARDAASAEKRQKQNAANQKAMTDKIKLLIEADKAEASGNVAKANILRNTALANKYAEDAKWTGAKAQAYIGNQNAAAGAHRASAARSYAAAAKDNASAGNGGGSVSSGGGSRIVLNNGRGTEVVSFNSKRYKNLLNVVPDMVRVLERLNGKYKNAKLPKDKTAKAKYEKIYNALSNPTLSSSKKLDIVFQNAREFPQLYHHIRQAIGVENVPTTHVQPHSSVVKPQGNETRKVPQKTQGKKGKGGGSHVMGEELNGENLSNVNI